MVGTILLFFGIKLFWCDFIHNFSYLCKVYFVRYKQLTLINYEAKSTSTRCCCNTTYYC